MYTIILLLKKKKKTRKFYDSWTIPKVPIDVKEVDWLFQIQIG